MRALFVALAWVLVASCATGGSNKKESVSSDASIEREIELTAEIHAQIRERAPLIQDPILLDFLYEIGQEIVAATEPQPFIYRFFVIDDDELNAFTIGGGYVYLNREVVAQAGDINELAGVLAHEIAHVRQRHIARGPDGTAITTLATLASIAAVAAGADPGVLLVAQGLNQSLQIQHTRRHEAEADREGLAYMVETGYEPLGMTRFFERILTAYPDHGDGIPSYLYTHPALEDRVAAARVELKRIDAPVDVHREDARLLEMQARLAQHGSTIAGGGGLRSRAQFDRSRTDALLDRARALVRDDSLDYADELLTQAQQAEPGDPRVPLLRADIAQQSGELEQERDQLMIAWRLDPWVPLVQYRLGSASRRLGERSRAAFYLEQVATSSSAGSSLRERATAELRRLEFPLLEDTGFDDPAPASVPPSFRTGQTVGWWARVGARHLDDELRFELEWLAPDGRLHRRDEIGPDDSARLEAELETADTSPLGTWRVRVRHDGDVVAQRPFELRAAVP